MIAGRQALFWLFSEFFITPMLSFFLDLQGADGQKSLADRHAGRFWMLKRG
jgi:hypothetical protein